MSSKAIEKPNMEIHIDSQENHKEDSSNHETFSEDDDSMTVSSFNSITSIQKKNIPPIKKQEQLSKTRKSWLCCTWSLTWWIPTYFIDKCGKMKRPDIQIAWREKIALNIIILFCCGLLLFYIIGLGQIICPKTHTLSQGEIDGKNKIDNPYVSIYGSYYKIAPIVKSHVYDNQWLNEQAMESTTLGHDVSPMFYKTNVWSHYCGLPQPSGWDNIVRTIPENSMTIWNIHSAKDGSGKPKDYIAMMSFMRKGFLARDKAWIASYLANDPTNNFIITAYGKVYDVSTYMQTTGNAKFLGDNMKKIFATFGPTGGDATQFIEQIKVAEGKEKWAQYMRCMDGLLITGVVDQRNSPQCQFSNYMLLVSTIVLVLIIGVKFLAALQFTSTRSPEDHDKFVICAVPCYTENAESLAKTLESLALSRYDEKRKLLFIIADGMVTGGGNDRPTSELLLQVLGWNEESIPEPQLFQSLGEGYQQLNHAQVYSGLYEVEGRYTPYIVVVKIGNERETHKAGNRGKRDSQMIILQFLSRVQFRLPMNPLELELYHSIQNVIGFKPEYFEYILWVDADTEIYPDAINRMVSCMINDSSVVGICGETLIKNEGDSWVTMIQVYEYFISHHLAKAFESMFGSVTCLPGCFCMYRIKTPMNEPCITNLNLIKEYGVNKVDTLHMKNLLSLGEDRFLTTLMMKHFPRGKLKFTADAKAKTVVPEKWSILLSQRRRWINSTVHNLFELLMLSELCGFCLFSMRFVIFMDLFATVVQPAGMIYVIYLVYSIFTDEDHVIPTVSLIMIGCIYGLQVVIFILKREWQHIGWMIIYILSMPLYAFYLPLYSFWHFDDFSWGQTRVVLGDGGLKVYTTEEEPFDSSMIPLTKWSDYEEDMNLVMQYQLRSVSSNRSFEMTQSSLK